MGYQPRAPLPRFVDENGKPIPPGMFTTRYNVSDVYAMFGIQDHASRAMAPQSYDPNRSTYVPPLSLHQARAETYNRLTRDYMALGCTAQEAADALTWAFASGGVTIASESIGDSSDGIAPCGYEEL